MRPPIHLRSVALICSLALFLFVGVAHAADGVAFGHSPPTTAQAGSSLLIEGTLNDPRAVRSLVVRFRTGAAAEGAWESAPMELQYGDLYRARIPAKHVRPPALEYFVEATLADGKSNPVFMRAEKPARVTVAGEAIAAAFDAGEEAERIAPDPVPEPRSLGAPGKGTKRLSALEEELAMYAAMDAAALSTKQDPQVRTLPWGTTVLDRADIRALGARSVHDVLDVIPGLSVSRDVQGFYRVGVRGIRSDPELLFLLNGHPLNNGYDGRALASLSVENVERIEVVRGPSAQTLQSGAFLGSVNIVTRSDEEDVLRGALSGGSFDSFDGHVDVAQRVGGVKLLFDADLLSQTGYSKPVLQDSLQRNRLIDGLVEDELAPAGSTNDRRLLFNVGGGARFETDGAGRLDLQLRVLGEDRSALIGLFDTVSDDSELGWTVLIGDLNWRKSLGATATVEARAFFDLQSVDRLFQLAPDGLSEGAVVYDQGLYERTEVGTRRLGLEASSRIQLFDANHLTLGVVAQHQTLTDYSYTLNQQLDGTYLGNTFERPVGSNGAALPFPQELGAGAASSRMSLGLVAMDQWSLLDRLSLSFGFRVDAVELPTVDPDGTLQGKRLVSSFNPRAGLVWSPADSLALRLGYVRGFRAPTFQELAETIPGTDYNQGRFEGNPDLDPATVDSFEAGADLIQAVGDARVRLRGTAFYESFTSPIAAVDDSGNVIPVRNRVGVRVIGAEGEARLHASHRANAWVNASWFRALDVEAVQSAQWITDVPQLRLNAGLSMPLGNLLNFDLLVRVGAERRNNARSKLEYLRRYRLPAYTLVTAQVRTETFANHFQLALVGNNLLDQEYLDDAPRPDRMPGQVPREGLSGFLTLRAFY